MGLIIPGVGTEASPTWATDLNASLASIDSHNHSSGQGVQIQPNGMNINADLAFQGNNATLLRSTRFSPQGAVLSGSLDVGCLYVVGNELYYNDVTGGHNVQITSSGSVNATSSGISSGTASAAFSAGVLVVKASSSSGANTLMQSLVLTNSGNLTNQLTVQAPSLAASYSLTLPSVPVSTELLQIDTSGNISANSASTQALNPTGAVIMFAGSSAPSGYLLCNGSAVSRTTYSSLFSVVGTTYGSGDGSTTFNLPNTQGIFVRSAGSQTIVGKSYSATLGTSENDKTAVNGLTISDPEHNHGTGGDGVYIKNGTTGLGGVIAAGTGSSFQSIAVTGSSPTGISLRGDTETQPANLALNYIIKT